MASISFTSVTPSTAHSLRGESFQCLPDVTNTYRRLRISNIFVIGEGTKPWISLPRGKGTKLTITEERDVRRRQRAAESQ